MMRIGGHFHSDNPLEDAVACGARVAQFFLGDPQGWKGPVIPGGDPGALRDAYAAAGVDVYIHAPYVINVASTNNRIRIPSRKLLDQQLKAAAAIGAKGLIVHGGHVTGDTDPAAGVANWVKAIEQLERPLPMLIENTAGGNGAIASSERAIAPLPPAVFSMSSGSGRSICSIALTQFATPVSGSTSAVTCPPCTMSPFAPIDAAAFSCWSSSFLLGMRIRLLVDATLITYGAWM
jgi:deoxyribonuclease-4